MSDRKEEVDLFKLARVADDIGDEHEGHDDCQTTPVMRAVSGALRYRAAAEAAHKGPAQVATPAYRANWDTLFGKKQPVGQA